MDQSNGIKKLSTSELSLFCYQFSVVLKAGLPYIEALHLLSGDVFEGKMKQLAHQIYLDAEQGMPLSEAIAVRGVFPEYMVAMLRIAENTGRLPEVFEQLSKHYEQNEIVKQKVKNALVYPIVLIGLMAAVILLLVLKVLPIFHEILLSVGGEIPTATQFVLDFSEGLQNGLLIIIGVAAIAAIYLVILFKTRLLLGQRDRLLIKAPVAAKLYKQAIVVKFASALSILTKSGMPIQSSLDMILPLMENAYVEEKLKTAISAIEAGKPLAVALDETNLFPKLFIRMITLGDKTGELDRMLDKISSIYDAELSRGLHRMTVSIEPTLVIILSLVVGAILLLVMLPLINIMSSIG